MKAKRLTFTWTPMIPSLKRGKQEVTVAASILVQMLVLNLKPERKTLGSLFPVETPGHSIQFTQTEL